MVYFAPKFSWRWCPYLTQSFNRSNNVMYNLFIRDRSNFRCIFYIEVSYAAALTVTAPNDKEPENCKQRKRERKSESDRVHRKIDPPKSCHCR